MNASFPMDGQDEFCLGTIHIDEDFLNESPGDALLELGTCGRIGPDRLQLTGELVQVFPRVNTPKEFSTWIKDPQGGWIAGRKVALRQSAEVTRWVRETPSFRETPAIVPRPNSYSRRIHEA